MPTPSGKAGIASFGSGDSIVNDQLIIGEQTPQTLSGVVLSGQVLDRGTVLGQITASGKYILSLSAAVDGSQTPTAILQHDTDATAGDVITTMYITGGFNQNRIILGTGHTIASVREGLRLKDIHLINAIPAS